MDREQVIADLKAWLVIQIHYNFGEVNAGDVLTKIAELEEEYE